jgi:hypothetical protein
MKKIVTFGLTDNQSKIAERLINENKRFIDTYSLKEVDAEMLESWIDCAKDDGDEEYENFLAEAQLNDADVYILMDNIGDFSQGIGDVAVFYN